MKFGKLRIGKLGKNRAVTIQNLAHGTNEMKNLVDEVPFQTIVRAPVSKEFLEIAYFPRFRLAYLQVKKVKVTFHNTIFDTV